jgi:hypothetical protein
MIFKCVNTPVADMTTGEILEPKLLPVATWEYEDLLTYLERRVYSSSNITARQIALQRVERTSHKLGLSDSYWLCSDPDVKFEDVSPYYQEFGTLYFAGGLSEPTLQLGGSFVKEWGRLGTNTYIWKTAMNDIALIEYWASLLAARLGVGQNPSVSYKEPTDGLGLGFTYVPNISSPEKMLLDFGSVLSMKSLEDGYVFENVQKMYSKVGFIRDVSSYILRVILLDGIVANEDRVINPGNWGFFKATDTGKVSLSPAYDYNMAGFRLLETSLFERRVTGIKQAGKADDALNLLNQWEEEVNTICQQCGNWEWHQNLIALRAAL